MSTGPFTYVLNDHRAEIDRLIDGRDRPAALRAIEDWCSDHRLRIWFHAQGKCFIGFSPEQSRCHALAGTRHWSNVRPNFKASRPSTCADCQCFTIDGEHAEFWRARYVQNMTAWLEARASGCEGEFRIAKARADQSAAILQRLQQPLPIVEIPHA